MQEPDEVKVSRPDLKTRGGQTQTLVYVRACPTDVLEMVPWDGCKAAQIASAPRTEDCIGCKRCESACPTDHLSVRVYLGAETTRSMGIAY